LGRNVSRWPRWKDDETHAKICVDPAAVTPLFMDQIASQPWFHERVFDIYLWTVGGKPSSATSASQEDDD